MPNNIKQKLTIASIFLSNVVISFWYSKTKGTTFEKALFRAFVGRTTMSPDNTTALVHIEVTNEVGSVASFPSTQLARAWHAT